MGKGIQLNIERIDAVLVEVAKETCFALIEGCSMGNLCVHRVNHLTWIDEARRAEA